MLIRSKSTHARGRLCVCVCLIISRGVHNTFVTFQPLREFAFCFGGAVTCRFLNRIFRIIAFFASARCSTPADINRLSLKYYSTTPTYRQYDSRPNSLPRKTTSTVRPRLHNAETVHAYFSSVFFSSI